MHQSRACGSTENTTDSGMYSMQHVQNDEKLHARQCHYTESAQSVNHAVLLPNRPGKHSAWISFKTNPTQTLPLHHALVCHHCAPVRSTPGLLNTFCTRPVSAREKPRPIKHFKPLKSSTLELPSVA